MNDKIDLVIKWVDNEDPVWKADYEKYKAAEIKAGKQTADNTQAFGIERTRNWHILKYWFRSVEKNCTWFNKIFFVCQRPSQVPAWLNTKSNKIRVVYHDEFIPAEFLPTFNTWNIEMFIHRIPDLADKFISFDDDFFVLNPIKPDTFFKNNLPVIWSKKVDAYHFKGIFGKVMNNTTAFEHKLFPSINYTYAVGHLPIARIKSFEKNIVDTHYDEIANCFRVSKFRHEKNITHLIFPHIESFSGKAVLDQTYTNSKQITLSNNTDYNSLSNYEMVCFNDSEAVADFKNIKNKLIHFLNLDMQYWNYSSFETYDYTIIQDKRKEHPKFSILIPVFNREKFIRRAIECLPKRNDLEIIALDDGSTDSSLSILKSYPEITIIKNKGNYGIAMGRNILLKEASGEYICFLDSDDFFYTNEFNNVLNKITPDIDVYRTKKERNDGKKYWPGVWIGYPVKRSLLAGIWMPDIIIDEDKFMVKYAYEHKKNINIVLGEELYYHYNFPNEDSLAWRYLNHLNDGRTAAPIVSYALKNKAVKQPTLVAKNNKSAKTKPHTSKTKFSSQKKFLYF